MKKGNIKGQLKNNNQKCSRNLNTEKNLTQLETCFNFYILYGSNEFSGMIAC